VRVTTIRRTSAAIACAAMLTACAAAPSTTADVASSASTAPAMGADPEVPAPIQKLLGPDAEWIARCTFASLREDDATVRSMMVFDTTKGAVAELLGGWTEVSWGSGQPLDLEMPVYLVWLDGRFITGAMVPPSAASPLTVDHVYVVLDKPASLAECPRGATKGWRIVQGAALESLGPALAIPADYWPGPAGRLDPSTG
jgi:hypothetical protein